MEGGTHAGALKIDMQILPKVPVLNPRLDVNQILLKVTFWENKQ